MAGAGEVCRTCLGAQALAPLFPKPAQYRSYQLALRLSTGLQIKLDDGLPQTICQNCTKSIEAAMVFRKQCRAAEAMLLQVYKYKDIGVLTSTVTKDRTQKRPARVSSLNKLKRNEIKLESENDINKELMLSLPECPNSSDGENLFAKTENTSEIKIEFDTPLNIQNGLDTIKPLKIKNEITEIQPAETKSGTYHSLTVKLETQNCTSTDVEEFNIKSVSPPANGPDSSDDEDLLSKSNNAPRIINELKTKIEIEITSCVSDEDHLFENSVMFPETGGKIKRFRSKKGEEPYLDLIEGPLDASGSIQCKVCKKVLQKNSFAKHALMHLGYLHLCEHCGKRYANNNALVRHHRIKHGMERDICCPHCDFKALDNEQMTLHVRARHTGERPFVCDVCGASFTGKRLLIQHLPKHSDHRPVQCNACPSKFKTKHDLVVHKSRVHRPREWRYECYICNNSYARTHNVRRHIRKFHNIPVKEQEELRKIRLE